MFAGREGGYEGESGLCRLFHAPAVFFNDRERTLEHSCPMANPNSILAFESRFGPHSNRIDVAAFVWSASDQPPLQAYEADHDVIQECRCEIFPLSLTPGQMKLTRTSSVWTI
jgi:hypothetical protein